MPRTAASTLNPATAKQCAAAKFTARLSFARNTMRAVAL
jgi:hypothetical protein